MKQGVVSAAMRSPQGEPRHGRPPSNSWLRGANRGKATASRRRSFGVSTSRSLPRRVEMMTPCRSKPIRRTYSLLSSGEGGVGRAPGKRTHAVAQGDPVCAVVGGHLDAVGGGHPDRVPADDDPVRRHVLPLGAQLAEGPVGPGLPAVAAYSPAVAQGAVPDLAPLAEGEGMDEVPGDAGPGGVTAELLPGGGVRGETEDPAAVGPDPHAFRGDHGSRPGRGCRSRRNREAAEGSGPRAPRHGGPRSPAGPQAAARGRGRP